jgi:hypothetical protein
MKKKEYIVRTQRFNGRNLDHKYFYFTSLYKAQLFVTTYVNAAGELKPILRPESFTADFEFIPTDRDLNKTAYIHRLVDSMSTVEKGVTSGTEIMKDDNFTYVRKFDYTE